ncbi:MAG: glycine cleavage system protein GcvH [Epulopiscium sp.]|nr:glycine cleavage system protein GcvH [Candidatus Epulonipiscium sp.]
MEIKQDLFYTEDHDWIRVEGKRAYIGITDYAQAELGDIVFVDLPEVEDVLEKDDILGAVESVKAASDIYAPIGGTVVEINEKLIDEPELINEQPYESWMVCIEMDDEDAVKELLLAEEYETLIQEEE